MKQRDGFSMLELVFVIVVLGILASMAIPRIDRDRQIEAVDNLLSAIRYTQHLALMDDKTSPSENDWQKKFWHIQFVNTDNVNSFYIIGSDEDKSGSLSKDECAIDPSNSKYFYHHNNNPTAVDESENVLLGHKYGINKIEFKGGCANVKHIAFDRLGRPHVGLGSAANDYRTYMPTDCNITFSYADSTQPFTLTIKAETGYVYVSSPKALENL